MSSFYNFYNKRRDEERKRGKSTDSVYMTEGFSTNGWHCVINEPHAVPAHTLQIVDDVLSRVAREMESEMSDAEPEPVFGLVGEPSWFTETQLAAWIAGDDGIDHEAMEPNGSLPGSRDEGLSVNNVGACKAKGWKNRRARRKAARNIAAGAQNQDDAEVVDLEAVDLDVGDFSTECVREVSDLFADCEEFVIPKNDDPPIAAPAACDVSDLFTDALKPGVGDLDLSEVQPLAGVASSSSATPWAHCNEILNGDIGEVEPYHGPYEQWIPKVKPYE